MNNLRDVLALILGSIFLTCCFLTILMAIFSKSRFNEICDLYERKFGELPLAVSILKECSPFGFTAGYAVKNSFILRPLIFGKKSIHSKVDDVFFMKKLPPRLKYWFIIDFYISLIAFISMVACVVIKGSF